MTIKVNDIDQVEAWKGGAMLGPGRHTVRIEKAEEGISSGGHDQIELEFSSDNGSILDWLVIVPATLGKARSLLEAAGIEVEGGEWDFPTESLVGKSIDIMIGEEPDNRDPTKTRRRVQAYEAAEAASNGGGSGGSGVGDPDIPF